MDFTKTIYHLDKYTFNPELLTFHIFIALLDHNIIDHFTFRRLKKQWNQIQYIQDEIGASQMTNYQEFVWHMNKLIKKEWNWNYNIGIFSIPNGIVRVFLRCKNNIKYKFIDILAYDNNTTFQIENESGIIYKGIEDAKSYCSILNKLNQCKKCRIVSLKVSSEGYCVTCQNIAASSIQTAWRECISNPEYYICRKRLQQEFDELT
jgi:hypothetical protein